MENVEIQPIYKIEDREVWNNARISGSYNGAAIDIEDGFIHFSTASQSRETAAKHFDQRKGLIIAAIDPRMLGDELKWEVSRANALFPHYYGVLDMAAVIATYDLPLDASGKHVFPDSFPK